jgi:hypothetical protein
MGAWDYGIFDDDTAYEFTDEIIEDSIGFFKSSFEDAIKLEYLEYDDGFKVLVSAAYIDNLINGTTYRTDNEDEEDESNVNFFGILHKGLNVVDLKSISVSALKKVISDKSELNELWADNEELYPKWKNNIEELIGRLS